MIVSMKACCFFITRNDANIRNIAGKKEKVKYKFFFSTMFAKRPGISSVYFDTLC